MRSTVVNYTWSEYLSSLPAASGHGSHSGGDWTDNETFDSALAKMANGDDTYVGMANKLLDKLEAVSGGVPETEWAPSVYGAYPVVAEFINGRPDCMRRRLPTAEPKPLRVIVSSTCSGGIDRKTMTERGVALLALVQKLQMVRPVELVILVEGNVGGHGNLFQIITVDTKPLSVAHACFALANVGFARALTYAHMHQYHKWNGAWPSDYRLSGYESIVRDACGFSPEDLWITSAYMHDSLLTRDPVAWVNQQIAKYGGAQEN